MARYCKKCGSELEDGSIFCNECGARTVQSAHRDFSNNVFKEYNIDMMDGEKIVRQSQVHEGCLIVPGIVFAFGIFIGFLIMFAQLSSYYFSPGLILMGFFNIFTIVGLVWLIIRFIAYKTNDLILTNKRVFGKIGLISTTQMQSPLNKIDAVSHSNGLMGKLIGYGTVEIATTSSKFKFRFIREGQTFYNDIFNQLEASEIEKRNDDAKAIVDAMEEKLS